MSRTLRGATCSESGVRDAKAQAQRMVREAEKLLQGGSYPACEERLATAKETLAGADKVTGDALERRNAYVRATFHAGQARVCPIVHGIQTGQAGVTAGTKALKAAAKKRRK